SNGLLYSRVYCGYQSNFVRFPFGTQPFISLFTSPVTPNSGSCCHIQYFSHCSHSHLADPTFPFHTAPRFIYPWGQAKVGYQLPVSLKHVKPIGKDDQQSSTSRPYSGNTL